MKKINLCSLGDPTHPGTWSGTPYRIYSGLIQQNRMGMAMNASVYLHPFEKKITRGISKLFYAHSVDLVRGSFQRYLLATKIALKTSRTESKCTLHTGTLTLPFLFPARNQSHYLFCDSTWNLWSNHSTHMEGYSASLLSDAERLERKAYHQMAHIFPISEYVKNNLISHYNVPSEKITVVGTGLGIIQPFYGEKNYRNGKILFAAKGRFEDKGGPLVLEAFQKALKINPTLELIVVGQNEYTDKILGPNIRSYGFLPIDTLQNLFNESSVFLMPALNEPWGLVYLEALACKMPIIGLNRNSFPEISANGKFGFGLDSSDPEALSRVLLQAFSDPAQLEMMGKNGQAHCLQTYSWENTVSIIIQTILQNEKSNRHHLHL